MQVYIMQNSKGGGGGGGNYGNIYPCSNVIRFGSMLWITWPCFCSYRMNIQS